MNSDQMLSIIFIDSLSFANQYSFINSYLIAMNQKGEEPLHFFGASYDEVKTSIGKNREVNPNKLIPPRQTSIVQIEQPKPGQFTGKFLNDHLLTGQELEKGKKINKTDKRTHFKTKMCPYGRDCKRQFTCTFAHFERELRKPFMKRTTACVLYQKGMCQLGAACREYHGNMDLKKKNYKYKTEICKDYVMGKCLKGPVCIFIHEMPQGEEIQQIEQEYLKLNQQVQEEKKKPDIKQQSSPFMKKDEKIEVVETVQIIDKTEQIVEGGLCFNFNFAFNP